MLASAVGKLDGKEFISHAPGYWSRDGGMPTELWNDWKWQLKNRVTSLAQLERHIDLCEEERSGVLLSGDKLALAITPHFFNLIPRENPDDPIRRQVMPRIEETWTSPYDMVDPCGEDSHMPVPGLVHRYPDRVLFLVTDRCAAYCRYCTRSRVVSGVGGQYNFVAMAHALPEARSILTLRSTRDKNSTVTSNILWSYGNTTIPRHLRDIVVTEYGVADLRGLSDQDTIAALLNIADSRFQDGLKREAQAAGKLRLDHRIPDLHRNNTPRALEERFILARARGLFSEFPFGTDFTGEEIVLAKALTRLKEKSTGGWLRVKTVGLAAASRGTPSAIRPYLERMSLNAPKTRQEWLWQRLLVQELRDMA